MPMGRPVSLPGPLGDLARAVGGVAALGALLAVSPRTIRQWAHGERALRGPALLAVVALCKKHKITPPQAP